MYVGAVAPAGGGSPWRGMAALSGPAYRETLQSNVSRQNGVQGSHPLPGFQGAAPLGGVRGGAPESNKQHYAPRYDERQAQAAPSPGAASSGRFLYGEISLSRLMMNGSFSATKSTSS